MSWIALGLLVHSISLTIQELPSWFSTIPAVIFSIP